MTRSVAARSRTFQLLRPPVLGTRSRAAEEAQSKVSDLSFQDKSVSWWHIHDDRF